MWSLYFALICRYLWISESSYTKKETVSSLYIFMSVYSEKEDCSWIFSTSNFSEEWTSQLVVANSQPPFDNNWEEQESGAAQNNSVHRGRFPGAGEKNTPATSDSWRCEELQSSRGVLRWKTFFSQFELKGMMHWDLQVEKLHQRYLFD